MMKNIVTETYTRTAVKTAVYRVFSLTATVLLTIFYGATLTQALSFGIWAFVSGLFIYYVYERLWLFMGWFRDSQGKDAKVRSIVKAILYRVVVWLVVVASSRVIFTDSNITAMLMASSQFVVNVTIYFCNERVWNIITWGKQIPEAEPVINTDS
jgi:uncharacterized membrane protein